MLSAKTLKCTIYHPGALINRTSGFSFPKVAKSACAPERIQVDKPDHIDGAYSLARTCEISMQTTLGRPYESGVYLVDKTLEM
ncbi:MAG: hypothetical protein ACI4AX_07660 [Muribaculaceae bacterium]